MFGISPPGRFDKGCGHSACLLGAAAFQNVVEIVFVAVAILPRYFGLAAPGFARSLEIQIEVVPLRNIVKNIADENLKTIPDDLAPAMRE